MIRTALAVGVSALLATPAYASGSIALPDPSGITLFSLGVAGLILGRRVVSGSKDKDRD